MRSILTIQIFNKYRLNTNIIDEIHNFIIYINNNLTNNNLKMTLNLFIEFQKRNLKNSI